MDQLIETLGIDWRLLLMQAVNFGLLLLILWRFVYRPVLAMIDERREKIAEGVRTAEAANARLAEADAEGKGIIGSASREAELLVANARMRADESAVEIAKTAEKKAAMTLADASARAEESKRLALKEVQRDIVRAAMLAAEKILRTSK
jgi:F-type H+-transporting ATPase subunit b